MKEFRILNRVASSEAAVHDRQQMAQCVSRGKHAANSSWGTYLVWPRREPTLNDHQNVTLATTASAITPRIGRRPSAGMRTPAVAQLSIRHGFRAQYQTRSNATTEARAVVRSNLLDMNKPPRNSTSHIGVKNRAEKSALTMSSGDAPVESTDAATTTPTVMTTDAPGALIAARVRDRSIAMAVRMSALRLSVTSGGLLLAEQRLSRVDQSLSTTAAESSAELASLTMKPVERADFIGIVVDLRPHQPPKSSCLSGGGQQSNDDFALRSH
jgi:hypothetical protein